MPCFHHDDILSPTELKRELPANAQHKKFIDEARQQISNILNGKNQRFLIIVGPCSIHDIIAAEEYASKLQQLMGRLSDNFFVIMRAYFEKPRTKKGWKGLIDDPLLNGSHDTVTGLRWARKFLLHLAELGIPAATEFLHPFTSHYIGDLISWACIGARTSESQVHRQMASGLSMPIAFKNNTSGSLETAVNGVLSATEQHAFIDINDDGCLSMIRTSGNQDAHVVLRGGEDKPNYGPPTIAKTLRLLQQVRLPLRVLVDCSHDNCNREHKKQVDVFQSVIDQCIHGNPYIHGMLLESHLFPGNQSFVNPSELQYGVSLTDPCLGWLETEQLLLKSQEALENSHHVSKSEVSFEATALI